MSEDIEARIFADWSMAFVPFAKLNGKDQTGFRDIQRLRDCKPLEPLMQSSEIAIYVKTFLGNFRF